MWLKGLSPAGLLIASDFDGTLSEIVPQPSSARPLPVSINALRRLVTLVKAVAVISGRSTAALEELLPIDGLIRLGDYGLGEAGTQERLALAAFNADAGPLLAGRPGVRLEAKPGSSSVHHRGADLDPGELLRQVAALAERHGLAARSGREVVEVTPARARKEVALERLLEEIRPGAVLFAGDDTGDRGCFELLSGLELPHLAVGVASAEAPESLFAACDLVVAGPGELGSLLSRIAGWAAEGRRSG